MRKWDNPNIINLNVNQTNTESDYITVCNWVDNEIVNLRGGKEDYTNPNNKPTQHPDWVWCHKHNRWHPKDHGNLQPSYS